MSRIGSYPNISFTELQKFLVLDPSTSSTSLVLGSDLVSYITPKINSVRAESTRISAENTDYKVGQIIQTSGATVIDDGLATVYLVVAGGAGDFPMINGNDLLTIVGDDGLRADLISTAAGKGASIVSMEGGPNVEAAVLARASSAALASDSAGEGASLVSMEGGPTVEAAVLARALQTEFTALSDNVKWLGTPVGETLALPTNLAGIVAPPTDNASFRSSLLTAGESGVGEYNETILTGETVTGSAPLVVATAVINLAASPIDGLTVNLLNSEGRYIKPGTTSGAVANDKMQQITGTVSTQSDQGIIRTDAAQPTGSDLQGAFSIGSNTYSNRVGTGGGTSAGLDFDSADSPNARTGTSTDVKNIQKTYYMRIA
jgi:hypothetical protein